MSAVSIPPGYQRIMPYLILEDAAGFFEFTRKVFGATEKMKVMRDPQTIMHAELQIGDSTVMFADASDDYPEQTAGLFIYVPDADETYGKALKEGAESVMEPSNQEYGRTCGILDPAGNTWWVTSAPQ